ncbi:type IV pilus assembly protein PilC [Lachnospira eligens ATCC 27750]|mgnify:FL=1|jgi:type IV pilus assembly protein PilC|uniref:Type IV pilus assembly protein PilC n=2 Tax=Lachnospira eligens TaxID=39485 RepID=C4Z594_LACE2|nr:type IV pilus assembly protein PilC [[Eubacterium] eligens ATCC 27750]
MCYTNSTIQDINPSNDEERGMESFSYKAVSAAGKDVKGSVEAESREEAARKIKEQGLVPVSIGKQGALDKDVNIPIFKGKKIPARDMSVFCRQFASILKAGVSVINALEMLAEQTENKKLKEAIVNTQSNVEKGENLSDSMRQNDAFPSILIDMVRAGEASGSLENSLTRMAIQFEKDAKLNGIVKKAMMYPIVLLCVMIGVIIVMLTFVIPSFMTMFEDLDSELPVTTKAILAMSNSLKSYWYIYIIVVVGIVVGIQMYKRTDNGKHNLDKLKLKIPVFGLLQTKSACASFARTMSTLLQAGMPMIDALEISASTMKNVLFYDGLEKAKNGVSLGLPLSNQLKATGLFPAMVVHMVGIGEETGNVEEMLTNSAAYYEEEVEVQTQTLTSLMEPIIIVLMALVVVMLIMAIYQPMIQLYNTLGNA